MSFFKLPAIIALVAGISLSHAISSIPIDQVKASSTLLDKGQITYRPENMIMKKNVHPFYQVWGATFKDQPITLEFTMGAQQVKVLTLFNGNLRDSSSFINFGLTLIIYFVFCFFQNINNLFLTFFVVIWSFFY